MTLPCTTRVELIPTSPIYIQVQPSPTPTPEGWGSSPEHQRPSWVQLFTCVLLAGAETHDETMTIMEENAQNPHPNLDPHSGKREGKRTLACSTQ
jgi:hypothetical protein